MAQAGTVEVEINVSGNLSVLARAFGAMAAALDAYGHEFSEEDKAALGAAAEVFAAATADGEFVASVPLSGETPCPR